MGIIYKLIFITVILLLLIIIIIITITIIIIITITIIIIITITIIIITIVTISYLSSTLKIFRIAMEQETRVTDFRCILSILKIIHILPHIFTVLSSFDPILLLRVSLQ